MSRRPIFLLVLTLVAAACSGAADTSTTPPTISETTTSQAPATTSPGVTETTQTTTTTQATTTTAGPAVTLIEIVVAGGTVDRVERFDLPLDGAVRLVVTADVSDEIHLHVYDLHADVAPGQEAVIEFDATIAGVIEIEMEDSGVLIGELQVAP